MNIRERVDKDHLADNYGADPATLLLMAEENTVIQGDSLHFDSLQQFIRSHDMADDTHWRHVDSLLDLHSFMDYFAMEMFSGNSDWPSNNLKYWKPSIHTGKWRYLMYDMDATMAAASWLPNDFDMFYWIPRASGRHDPCGDLPKPDPAPGIPSAVLEPPGGPHEHGPEP